MLKLQNIILQLFFKLRKQNIILFQSFDVVLAELFGRDFNNMVIE